MIGGKHPGGRPKGKKDRPDCQRQMLKREYRELYEEELVRILAKLRSGQRLADSHRRCAVRRLIRMQLDFAKRHGDSRALHDMIDRLVGRVPQPMEHGGPDGGPIPLDVGDKVFVCEHSDGKPVA